MEEHSGQDMTKNQSELEITENQNITNKPTENYDSDIPTLYSSKYRYNSNTFGVNPNDKILPVQQDTGLLPRVHKNYMVFNIGRTEVFAKLKYGTKVMWHGTADSATIQPGETKELNNGGIIYYVTGLKIYNRTDTRAIVHCATSGDKYFLFSDKENGTFDPVLNELLKQVFAVGVKQIPYVGTGLSGLVTAFWPSDKPSAWEEVQDKLKDLLDAKVLQTISAILSGDVRYYQERITTVSEEIEKGGDPENLRTHYVNIAQDMVGFENKFKFASGTPHYQNVNQFVLPHFSIFVLMKISFYVIGIRQAETIGLTEQDLENIKSYARKTVYGDGGANKYIQDLHSDRVDNVYKTWYAEDLYDRIMNVRTFIGTQGLEYIQIWNHMVDNPLEADKDPYNPVITYSTFFGRQTSNLIHQTTGPDVATPLTPTLVSDKHAKLSEIEIYIWRIHGNGAPKIGGQKLIFDNGESYVTGTESSEVVKVDVGDSIIIKLEARGRGAIDNLVFHFSDGRVLDCGTREENTKSTVFELKDHHIVSIYMASDNYSLAGQAANIAVAYQLNEGSSPPTP